MIRIDAETVWTATKQEGFWASLAEQMASALRQQAVGESASTPRQIIRTNTGNGLGVMAAIAEKSSFPSIGVKVVSLAPQTRQGRPSHPGTLFLIDPVSGKPQASIDADALTAVRTAATTCAITRHLRPEALSFAIIGTGTEARSHLLALSTVYSGARFTIWGRRPEAAFEIAAEYASKGLAVSAEPDLVTALRGADVITSLTAARSPFLDIHQAAETAHVNAIGASIPGLAEWTPDSFRSVDSLICDTVEECRRQSMEIPTEYLDTAHNASALLGAPPWGSSAVTGKRSLYKSVGSAVLDVAAGSFLLACD